MSDRLPTGQQCITASTHFHLATGHAACVYFAMTDSDKSFHARQVIEEMKKAAAALGLELVERHPRTELASRDVIAQAAGTTAAAELISEGPR